MILKIRWPNYVFASLSFRNHLGFLLYRQTWDSTIITRPLAGFPGLFLTPSSSHPKMPGSHTPPRGSNSLKCPRGPGYMRPGPRQPGRHSSRGDPNSAEQPPRFSLSIVIHHFYKILENVNKPTVTKNTSVAPWGWGWTPRGLFRGWCKCPVFWLLVVLPRANLPIKTH